MKSTGLTVERLVDKAHVVKEKIDALNEEFANLKASLIDVARERRGKENTVTLDGERAKAKVRFTQSVSFDSAALVDVVAILGERRFSKLFSTTRVFKARPELKGFLHKKGNLSARRAIAAATTVTDNAPKVRFNAMRRRVDPCVRPHQGCRHDRRNQERREPMQTVIFAAGIIVIVLGVLAVAGILTAIVVGVIYDRRLKASRARFAVIREFLDWLSGKRGMDISELTAGEIEDLLKHYCRHLDTKP